MSSATDDLIEAVYLYGSMRYQQGVSAGHGVIFETTEMLEQYEKIITMIRAELDGIPSVKKP